MLEDYFDVIPSGNILFGSVPEEYYQKIAEIHQEQIQQRKIEKDLALEALRRKRDFKSRLFIWIIDLKIMSFEPNLKVVHPR